MSAPTTTRLALSLTALALTMLVASLVLGVMNGPPSVDWGTGASSVLMTVPGVAFSLVGALLATRHPRNAVGWICLAVGWGSQ
ncbi:MAG: hypothetical protein M3401_17395 [Actinomycetota bacterium]|nr:hypothetical protein [Actinomycetota bacterium]